MLFREYITDLSVKTVYVFHKACRFSDIGTTCIKSRKHRNRGELRGYRETGHYWRTDQNLNTEAYLFRSSAE